MGCIDVSVARYSDRETRGPVAVFTLGNRCDGPVKVNLAMDAKAHIAGSGVQSIEPRDPDGEIGSALLEARSVAREYIEYEAPRACGARITRLCIDISGIDAQDPYPIPSWVCIGPDTERAKYAGVIR